MTPVNANKKNLHQNHIHYERLPKEGLFSHLNMQWLGMSTVDKEGESLAPLGIFVEIAGLQEEDCGIYFLMWSVSNKEYCGIDHWRGLQWYIYLL